MPEERAEVDGKPAVVRHKADGSTDVLYNFDPDLPHGHDHLKKRSDAEESAIFVRDKGEVVWDERLFNAEAKEALIAEARRLTEAKTFHEGHQRAQELRLKFKEIGFAGERTEKELRAAFEAALTRFYDQSKARRAEREKLQAEALKRKRTLISKAKQVAESSNWKQASAEMRSLSEQWKGVGSAGRDHDEKLWRDFNAARTRLRERSDAHFKRLEQEWEANRTKKRRIIAEAESLASSYDLQAASKSMRELMEHWKACGPAGREHDDQLWKAFNQARDRLSKRRDDASQATVLTKRSLLVDAADIAAYTSLKDAGHQWKALMARWKSAGRADRVTEDDLWSRLQNYRRQLDSRYEQAKSERQRRAQDGIQRLEAAAARKRQQIADLNSRIAEVYSRPPVRPGPKQWEIQSKRDNQISRLSSYRSSHQQALASIEAKLRDAYQRPT